jgi:hypothetical protein
MVWMGTEPAITAARNVVGLGVPALILCYAMIAEPNISAGFTFAIVLAGRNKSVWSHFFGSGCRADLSNRCLDQFIFTMPFYASAAYSFGALVARISDRSSRPETTAA